MCDYIQEKEFRQKYAHWLQKLRINITWVIEQKVLRRIVHIWGLLELAVGIAAPHMSFDSNHNCSCRNCYSNLYFVILDHRHNEKKLFFICFHSFSILIDHADLRFLYILLDSQLIYKSCLNQSKLINCLPFLSHVRVSYKYFFLLILFLLRQYFLGNLG